MRSFLFIFPFLFGCTTIDYRNHVEGWPKLKEELHIVSYSEMFSHCQQYSGFLEVPLACSEIYFNPPVCKIWVTEAGGFEEKHERAHCEGYDHPSSDYMKDLLSKYGGK